MESKQRPHHRRLTRLQEYDYSQPGAYFVTVCTKNRSCLFGEIDNDRMRLSSYGEIIRLSWFDLPQHYTNVELDAFVIMPNHIHGIIFLTDVGAGLKPAPTDSPRDKRHGLPEIIRAFKTFSSRQINKFRNMPGASVWQRNYYEHVIRRDESLAKIREYIETNPLRWALDKENPAHRR
jgi:REP element-mobilizing transposase RayT